MRFLIKIRTNNKKMKLMVMIGNNGQARALKMSSGRQRNDHANK